MLTTTNLSALPSRTLRTTTPLLTALTVAAGLLSPNSTALAQCPASFGAAANFPGGSSPAAIAIGDFNGDGKADVASIFSTAAISIRLGLGDGTFTSGINYATGSIPTSIAVGDLNNDGKLDLAVANSNNSSVSVFIGNGNGSFASAVSVPAGTAPQSVAIGDVNNDGRPDLVVASTLGNVGVILATGPGTFAAPVNYPIPGPSLHAVIADVNGDGLLDIVTANRDTANVSVLLNTGLGVFGAATNYAVGNTPKYVTVGDLNGDGKLDLVTANNGFSLSVLLANATEEGPAFSAATNYSAGLPGSVVIGDVNGDGKPDLAVAEEVSNVAGVLLGNGNGTFSTHVSFFVSGGPHAIAFGDFNGDGRRDIAVTTFSSGGFSMLLNTSSGPPAPVFTRHPANQIVNPGGSATFTAAATFIQATPNYRWRRNGVQLTDGGAVSGSSTATLTISPVSAADVATYDVQALGTVCNNSQTTITSNSAVLAVALPIAPANDECASAQPLPTAGYIFFNTASATTDGPQELNLGFGVDTQIHKDVWFTYTATCTGPVTFGLCASSFDTKIAIYSGTTCPGTANSAIAGNDDADCAILGATKSQVIFNAIAGHQYLIRVGGKNGAAGDAVMTYACDGSGCLSADLGVQGGTSGRDGQLDNNDFIAFINAFFNHTGCQ